MRRHHIERIIVCVLLITALLLWLPLVKWHRLFNINPQVEFTVPVFRGMAFKAGQDTVPVLPHLVAIRMDRVATTQLRQLLMAGYPAYVAKDTNAYIGPYLDSKEAQNTLQQVQQHFKIDATIVDYDMDRS